MKEIGYSPIPTLASCTMLHQSGRTTSVPLAERQSWERTSAGTRSGTLIEHSSMMLVAGRVQQKLVRHAQVSTTMNTYSNAQMVSNRCGNSKVVQMVLPSKERMSVL